ncbi:MAG: phosphoribosyl-AMP cyclohydrolase [Actinomycetaceae bacterium]|nr:phosphoribosyl-AMP cyclohydrolase [Actinomycetaceae bacterium]
MIMDENSFEEIEKKLKFDDAGLITAVIQDNVNNDVLMVGYMNSVSLYRTLTTGRVWFWSRSRQEYWRKGDTSGHIQLVRHVYVDCDGDCLLVKVEQKGGACHTGARTCFISAGELPVSGIIEEA